MTISSYDELLQEARKQLEPQRLLFVFTAAELPDNPAAAQKDQFLAGEGGALAPVMYVDKSPSELNDFSDLVKESARTGQNWDVVFVASMSGRAGIAPSSDEAEQSLLMMVEAVKNGNIGHFLTFSRDGDLIRLVQQV